VVNSLPLDSPRELRVAWIKDTLSLDCFFISQPLLHDALMMDTELEPLGEPQPFAFDGAGNLNNPFENEYGDADHEDPKQ
jgi:hypothetical protein